MTSDTLVHDMARSGAWHCAIAVLGIVFGTIGLLPSSWLLGGASSTAILQVLFGLLLCGFVAMRFSWWLQYCPPAQSLDVCRFSRESSRMVFLILYLVIGPQQIIRMIGYLQDHEVAHSIDISFLICGLIALVLIRVLAFWSSRRLGGH